VHVDDALPMMLVEPWRHPRRESDAGFSFTFLCDGAASRVSIGHD
jgi:hypothetical protein